MVVQAGRDLLGEEYVICYVADECSTVASVHKPSSEFFYGGGKYLWGRATSQCTNKFATYHADED